MIDITYDRSQKQYEWIHPNTGEVLTAPARQKQRLYREVVAMLEPELYSVAVHMCQHEPTIERIVWRGVELVINNKVTILDIAGNLPAMVASSDEYGRYALQIVDGGLTCQCEHWQSLTAPMTSNLMRVCKHIIAYQLQLMARFDESTDNEGESPF